MNITVFGATGAIGALTVAELLDNGDAVTGRNRIGFPVSRADIAVFTAAQVQDTRYIKAAPAISN